MLDRIREFLTKKFLLVVLILLILTLSIKVALIFSAPVGFNEGVYAYISSSILNGKTLYVDVFDHKPPILYYLLAGFFSLAGTSVVSLHAFNFLLELSFLISIFYIGKKLFNQRVGLIAALITSSIFFVGLEPDLLMALLLLWSFYFYFKMNYFLSGILYGLAIFSKQPALFFILSFLAYEIYLLYIKERTLKDFWKVAVKFILGAMIVTIPLFLLFWKIVGPAFIRNVIILNFNYATNNPFLESVPKLWLILFTSFGTMIALAIFSIKFFKEKLHFLLLSWFILPFLIFHLSGEVSLNYIYPIAPAIVFLAIGNLDKLSIDAKELAKLVILFTVIAFVFVALSNAYLEHRDSQLDIQKDVAEFIRTNTKEGDKILSVEASYIWLSGRENIYILPCIAPSIQNWFDLTILRNYLNEAKFIILTHREKYLV